MRLIVMLAWMVLSAVAACGGTPATTTLPSVTAKTSNLGPGDTFEVSVYGEEDLSGKYRVAEDGAINFPLIGRVEVAGRGPGEIALAIQNALRDRQLLRDPHVSVFLLEQTSSQISVVGAVTKPGSFALTREMTIVQAISAAGGLTPIASGDNTIVTRKANGQLKRFKVPVDAITEGRATDFPLEAGDIVFVPERIF
jgi:protein involved in polysaccharide export with SLBB domain